MQQDRKLPAGWGWREEQLAATEARAVSCRDGPWRPRSGCQGFRSKLQLEQKEHLPPAPGRGGRSRGLSWWVGEGPVPGSSRCSERRGKQKRVEQKRITQGPKAAMAAHDGGSGPVLPMGGLRCPSPSQPIQSLGAAGAESPWAQTYPRFSALSPDSQICPLPPWLPGPHKGSCGIPKSRVWVVPGPPPPRCGSERG